MNKNNIILLIIAILFFAFAVIFAYSSFTDTNTNTPVNNLSSNIAPVEDTAISEEDFFDSIDYENFIDFEFLDEDFLKFNLNAVNAAFISDDEKKQLRDILLS